MNRESDSYPGPSEHVDQRVDAEEIDLPAHQIADPRLCQAAQLASTRQLRHAVRGRGIYGDAAEVDMMADTMEQGCIDRHRDTHG